MDIINTDVVNSVSKSDIGREYFDKNIKTIGSPLALKQPNQAFKSLNQHNFGEANQQLQEEQNFVNNKYENYNKNTGMIENENKKLMELVAQVKSDLEKAAVDSPAMNAQFYSKN